MYITETELENYLKRDLTTKESASFTILEAAARNVVDNYCDTNWDSTVTASSRYYDGGEKEIDIDTCNTLTAIASVNYDESIENTYDSDDYVVEPKNDTVKWSIRKKAGVFPNGIRNIKVTATFSSYVDEVPSEVKMAMLKLVAESIQNPQGFKKESIEGYSYELNDKFNADEELKQLLGKYRRIYV